MKSFVVVSLRQLAELAPNSKVDDHSIRGQCNAYILLLAARNLPQAQVVELTGFSVSMVSDFYKTFDLHSRGRINNLIFTVLSMLSHEEIDGLRGEMKRDGEWMRARILELRADVLKD